MIEPVTPELRVLVTGYQGRGECGLCGDVVSGLTLWTTTARLPGRHWTKIRTVSRCARHPYPLEVAGFRPTPCLLCAHDLFVHGRTLECMLDGCTCGGWQ